MVTRHTMNTKIVKSLHKQTKKDNIVMVNYLIFSKTWAAVRAINYLLTFFCKVLSNYDMSIRIFQCLLEFWYLFEDAVSTYLHYILITTGRTQLWTHYGKVVRSDLLSPCCLFWRYFRNIQIINGQRVLAIKVLRPIHFTTFTCPNPKYYMQVNTLQNDLHLGEMFLVLWVILIYVPYIHWWKAGFFFL